MNLHIIDDHAEFRDSLARIIGRERRGLVLHLLGREPSLSEFDRIRPGDHVWTDCHKPYEANGRRVLHELKSRVGHEGRLVWMTANHARQELLAKLPAAEQVGVDLLVHKDELGLLLDDLPGSRRFFNTRQHRAFSKALMWAQLLPETLRAQIVGVGMGEGMPGQQELGVLYHVHADADDRAALANTLPNRMDGFPVRLLDVGSLVPASPRSVRRPAPAGVSISHAAGPVGTLGAFVHREGESGAIYLLSCNHVIGLCGEAHAGDPVVQPGVSDRGDSSQHCIARLTYVHPVELDSEENTVDAALARLDDPGCCDAEILGLGPCAGPFPLRSFDLEQLVGRRVLMRGRSSPPTEGVIAAAGFDILKHRFPFRGGYTGFREQIVVRGNDPQIPYSLCGDSGALVLDHETKQAVGMVFAHSSPDEDAPDGWVTYVNPIDELMENLRLTAIL